jgi:hypothetical protein
MAASLQAVFERCMNGSRRRRFSNVEPDIQKGITRPKSTANPERTGIWTATA